MAAGFDAASPLAQQAVIQEVSERMTAYATASGVCVPFETYLANGYKVTKENGMKIKLTSVYVDDQDKALKFYTEVLGFVKRTEIPLGEARWLTVVSPEQPDGTELLLEPDYNPDINPATKTFKKALYNAGIPFTMFHVDDIEKEYKRLKKQGVVFKMEPTRAGPVTIAVFDDTCGNLIQIAQPG